MHFPPWIDKPRDDKKRAALRLKYMLNHAALRRFGRTSMRDVAAAAGCDHSSIFHAINRGWFTESMAESIEKVFGPDELPKEALCKPLEVGTVDA